MSDIKIPQYVNDILTRLEAAGFEAFVVGGCVRDFIRGATPLDWDICTSANPIEVKSVFDGHLPVIPTGEKHGTVTILSSGNPVEVTTFRTDIGCSDARHPDSVKFVGSIEDDLSRRDFTVNAMAYNQSSGLIDLFGGVNDIQKGVLRCVGNAERRFREDALRIMRALRFAAVCELELEPETASAARRCAPLLKSISAERIFSEIKKLLAAKAPSKILTEYRDILEILMPQAFCKQNFDEVCCRMTDIMPCNTALRLAAIVYSAGEDGAAEILSALKSDRKTRSCVRTVIENAAALQNNLVPSRAAIKHMMRKIGAENTEYSLEFVKALCAANGTECTKFSDASALLREIIANGECYTISDLDISGSELMSLGISPGRKIGEIMDKLLCDVIDGNIENEKLALLSAARVMM